MTITSLTRSVEGAELPLAGEFTLDPVHTTVGFVARHLMVSRVRGGFTGFTGSIHLGETPADTVVSVRIDAASVDTREPKRDEHLRSADFLDVEHHPELVFTGSGLIRDGRHWRLPGDLTIRGVTRPVELEVEFHGATADPWGGERIGFSASTEIEREDFGLTWNAAIETGGVVVGPRVRIEIDAEAVRA